MTFQKQTYSGRDCNNYLYFAFFAEYFDPEIITDELKIKPSSVIIKRNPIPKSTFWEYRIDVGNEINLVVSLENLIDTFESKIDVINSLKKRFSLATRLQFVIFIDIDPNAFTPYFSLNKRTIDFLSKTNTDADFDLYKTDSKGSLNKL